MARIDGVKAACSLGYVSNGKDGCVSLKRATKEQAAANSLKCGTNHCGRTFPDSSYGFFNAVKPSMPLYGVRITLIDGNGDDVKYQTKTGKKMPMYVNLWATKTIYDTVYTVKQRGWFQPNKSSGTSQDTYRTSVS